MLEHRRKGMSGVRACKFCGVEVAMMATEKGHLVPVLAARVKPGTFTFDDKVHENHLRTCPKRRAGEKGGQTG